VSRNLLFVALLGLAFSQGCADSAIPTLATPSPGFLPPLATVQTPVATPTEPSWVVTLSYKWTQQAMGTEFPTVTHGPTSIPKATSTLGPTDTPTVTLTPSPSFTPFPALGCTNPRIGILGPGDQISSGAYIPLALYVSTSGDFTLPQFISEDLPDQTCPTHCAKREWKEGAFSLNILIVENTTPSAALRSVASSWESFEHAAPAFTEILDPYTGPMDGRFLGEFYYELGPTDAIIDVASTAIGRYFVLISERFESTHPITHWEPADMFEGLSSLEIDQLRKLCPGK
jgi:hypothetical protein